MNHAQNKRLHTLLTKLGEMAMKADYVIDITNGRTWHSSEMSHIEADVFIKRLQAKLNLKNETLKQVQGDGTTDNSKIEADKCQKLRRAIISKLREMGYEKDGKADMIRINTTILEHWKKELNAYDKKELAKILNVLAYTWLPHFYKKRNES